MLRFNAGGINIKAHRIRVCIIEDNRPLSELIENHVRNSDGFELAWVARDGRQGEELLLGRDYDAAIIEAILPYKDGISLLGSCKAYYKAKSEKKIYVMLTNVNHKALAGNAYDNGADYLFLKPFDMEKLFEKISELYCLKTAETGKAKAGRSKRRLSAEAFIDDLLYRLEIHHNLKGYIYLRTAIYKAIENEGVLNGITKILYPDIAKESASTPANVERVIRHAINESWTPAIGAKYAGLLANDAYLVKRPSNKAFILAAAEAYKRAERS